MRRARTLPIALVCLPLAAVSLGCTGAVSSPGASSGVRPTVDSEVAPTAELVATPDATNAATAPSAEPTLGERPIASAADSPGSALPATTGEAAPSATGEATDARLANDAARPTAEGTPVADGIAKSFQTPETDAAAAALREAPRVAEPPKPLSAEEKSARAAQPVLDLTFDDLKFDIAKDAKFDWSMTTEKMESLRGRRVRIRGWIHPSSAFSAHVRDFVFVRDNQECCFGPGAAVFDCMSVAMAPGKTARYTVLPIAVEGVLDLDPFDIDGVTRMLYRLDRAEAR